jgi:hypothetical protein
MGDETKATGSIGDHIEKWNGKKRKGGREGKKEHDEKEGYLRKVGERKGEGKQGATT